MARSTALLEPLILLGAVLDGQHFACPGASLDIFSVDLVPSALWRPGRLRPSHFVRGRRNQMSVRPGML
jgi:hypothetical protein